MEKRWYNESQINPIEGKKKKKKKKKGANSNGDIKWYGTMPHYTPYNETQIYVLLEAWANTQRKRYLRAYNALCFIMK